MTVLRLALYLLALSSVATSALANTSSTWRVAYSTKATLLSNHVMQRFVEQAKVYHIDSYLPFARRLRSLKLGEVDISAGLIKTASRERDIYFLQPPYIVSARYYFVLRKQELLPLEHYRDLYAFVIGVKNGAKHFRRFDEDPQINKVKLNDNSECLSMLVRKRLDVCLVREVGRHLAQNHPRWQGQFKIAPYQTAYDSDVYIGISRHSPLYEQRYQLEQRLAGMVESGQMDKTIQDFYQLNNIAAP
ncbi:substrate-binding periplasmic protein [Agarivorans gilvus]|uniref:Solute-binding protein family 3/N-terminal domain-containing protein n=1 Tax=Agarivorans gilvus TaxID=680279 RepID=A0ABQ1I2D6_9ALTE|nr:transporter substrate-binding domain-containing protein [Agarivorans gilvus]GGB06199.1 hypothetical protein GCM10007414_19360 [Agarivorans gilvus]